MEEIRTLLAMRKQDWLTQGLAAGIFVGFALCIWRTVALMTDCHSPIVVVLSGSMEPGYQRGDLLFLRRPTPWMITTLASKYVDFALLFSESIDASWVVTQGKQLYQRLSGRLAERSETSPLTQTNNVFCGVDGPATKRRLADNEPKSMYKVGDVVVFTIKGRGIPIVHRIHRIHVRRDPTSQENATTDGEQKMYFLTKGDNNFHDDRSIYPPGQMWISEDDIVGRSFAYLPYAGYATILFTDFPALRYIVIAIMGFLLLTSKDEF